jgi:hypothetical protein
MNYNICQFMMVTYLIENKKASAIYYIGDHFFPLTSDFFWRRRESWVEEGMGEGVGEGEGEGEGGRGRGWADQWLLRGNHGGGGTILAPTMEKLRRGDQH